MTDKKDKTKDNKPPPINKKLPVISSSLDRYLVEITQYPVPTREEEYDLAMLYKEKGDLEAARKLVSAHLRFVIKIANEYKSYGLNPMDIIQEGNIGLMQAVKRFDPTKGFRLISYAVWWIRAYMHNYIMKTWSLVKVGTTQAQRKLFYKLRSTKAKMDMTNDTLSPEDYESLAQELGVKKESVVAMDKRMGSRDLSLDAEINNDTTHLDFLETQANNQEQILAKIEEVASLRTNLETAYEVLNERERYIIDSRVLSDEPKTLEHLGNKLSISRERVRQIESAALKKIKSELVKAGVEG